MKEFPLTFRSRNFETWYRFHEDGSYEVVQKNKAVSSFSFGKFQEFPTEVRTDYMRKISERHIEISNDDFNTQMQEIFNNGYDNFIRKLTTDEEEINGTSDINGISSLRIEPGERKTISFSDDKELSKDSEGNNVIISLQESEVDRVTKEMRDEQYKNGF